MAGQGWAWLGLKSGRMGRGSEKGKKRSLKNRPIMVRQAVALGVVTIARRIYVHATRLPLTGYSMIRTELLDALCGKAEALGSEIEANYVEFHARAEQAIYEAEAEARRG